MAAGHVGLGFVPASDSSHSSPRVVADPEPTSAALKSPPRSGRSRMRRDPRRWPRQQRAHTGRRHSGRLRRSERIETVRAHHLGSPSCKPSAGSPSGRRMAPRSTTSVTAPSRLRCTAWCSSTPPPSSRRLQAAAGADLPQFVKDEFDAFLECGILAQGFLRLSCGDCGHDKLVAFSCKRRGFAHRAGPSAWPRPQRTWWTTSSRPGAGRRVPV